MGDVPSSNTPDLEIGPDEPHFPTVQSPSISHPSCMSTYNRRKRPILRSWSSSVLQVVDVNCDSTTTIVSDCHEEEYLFKTLDMLPVQKASAIRIFNVGFPLDRRDRNTLILLRHFDDCLRIPHEDVFNMRNISDLWRLRSSSVCFGVRLDPLHEGHNIYIQCFRRFGKILGTISEISIWCSL